MEGRLDNHTLETKDLKEHMRNLQIKQRNKNEKSGKPEQKKKLENTRLTRNNAR